MLNWNDLSTESETKRLLHTLGSHLDDYDDAATMIEAAYEKYTRSEFPPDVPDSMAFDWYCFSVFLKDSLPPGNLRIFGDLIENLFEEMEERNISLKSLGISPSKSGRPETMTDRKILEIIGMVKFEQKNASKKSEAYEIVAKSLNKSPDTIRRYYERWLISKSNGKK